MKNKQLISKILLTLVMTTGVAVAWAILASWFAGVVLTSRNSTHEQLAYTPTGEPIVQITDHYGNHRYRGFDGQPRDLSSGARWLSASRAAGVREPSWLPRPKEKWLRRMRAYNDGGTPATFWYFIHNGKAKGAGYFVGYDSISKRVIGYLGRNGFRDSPPVSTADQFAVSLENVVFLSNALINSQGWGNSAVNEPWHTHHSHNDDFPASRVYFIDEDRVVEVDLRRREKAVKTLLQADGLLSVAIMNRVNWTHDHDSPLAASKGSSAEDAERNNQPALLLVSTVDKILLYNPATKTTTSLDRPDPLKSKKLEVYRTRTGDYILQQSRRQPEGGTSILSYTLAADGAVESHFQVHLNGGSRSSPYADSIMASAAAPIPLASVLATLISPLDKMKHDKSLTYSQALTKMLTETWLFIAITIVLAVVLAWRCYLRQRRFGDPTLIPWIVLILILGLPGYIAYRLHRRWPVRLLCPNCNMPSPRDRVTCIDCGDDFPLPEPKGIELFA